MVPIRFITKNMIIDKALWLVPFPNLGFNLNWVVRMICILGSAYIFYLLVEHPGHLIARHLGRRLAPRKSAAMPACA